MNIPITIADVLFVVSGYYRIRLADLIGPRRHKSLVRARAIAMYLARKHTDGSYPEIARAFGNRHHTTVLKAVQGFTGSDDVESLEALLDAKSRSLRVEAA